MTTAHDKIIAWLLEQGYESGWVVSGSEITVWANEDPQPEIPDALKQDDV